MRRRLFPRIIVAIALGAVAVTIGAAVIAGPGSAHRQTRMLRLLATAQSGVGFAPDGEPQQGDRFGGGATISGDVTGSSRTICTVIGKRALCNLQLRLPGGQLSVQGLVPDEADHTRMAITGGTGIHSRARGTAVATQIGKRKTRFVLRLRS